MPDFEELMVNLPDGYAAYARYWRPDQPCGAVLYHHGIQSHCGWYETSARRLKEAGYAVLQADRRGSGRNLHERGHADSVAQLIGDAAATRDKLAELAGFSQHHVVGVSWGGKLAVAAYTDHPQDVLSLSLVTPGLFPKISVSRAEMARIGFAMIYEQKKRFDIPLNDPNLFTTTPRWQEFFRTDEPTLRACTASFYLASRRMDRIAARLHESPCVPIHLFLAGDERIVDNERTASFVRNLHWKRTRITTYEQARHSLEFEGDAEVYFADLVSFIREQDEGRRE